MQMQVQQCVPWRRCCWSRGTLVRRYDTSLAGRHGKSSMWDMWDRTSALCVLMLMCQTDG